MADDTDLLDEILGGPSPTTPNTSRTDEENAFLDELLSVKRGQLYDGDTYVREDGSSVRLAGGNTAEKNMPMGVEATRRAQELIDSGAFTLNTSDEQGYFGRDLGNFTDEHGVTMTQRLISEGYSTPSAYEDDPLSDLARRQAASAQEQGTLLADREAPERSFNTGSLEYNPNNAFQKSLARGTDQMQAMNFATLNAFGEAVGSEVLSNWGEEGMVRNLQEATVNPPEIASWDDVHSLADFGTYWIEALGEQIPQLGIDLGLALTGAGTGAVMARAAIGKALKRKLGEKAFNAYVRESKRRGLTAATGSAATGKLGQQLVRQGAVKGAKVGAVAGIYPGVTGESRITQLENGEDNPLAALATGIPKTGMEFFGLTKLVGQLSKATGAKPSTILGLVKDVSKRAGVSSVTEGSTEALQATMDFVALRLLKGGDYDFFSDENIHEFRESLIKGGLVGGGLTGGTAAITGGSRLALDRLSADGTVPEDPDSLQAQVNRVANPNNPRMFAYDATGATPLDVPEGTTLVRAPDDSTAVISDEHPELQAEFKLRGAQNIAKFDPAYGDKDKTELDTETVDSMTLRDEDGNEIRSVAVDAESKEATRAQLEAESEKGDTISEGLDDAYRVIEDRINKMSLDELDGIIPALEHMPPDQAGLLSKLIERRFLEIYDGDIPDSAFPQRPAFQHPGNARAANTLNMPDAKAANDPTHIFGPEPAAPPSLEVAEEAQEQAALNEEGAQEQAALSEEGAQEQAALSEEGAQEQAALNEEEAQEQAALNEEEALQEGLNVSPEQEVTRIGWRMRVDDESGRDFASNESYLGEHEGTQGFPVGEDGRAYTYHQSPIPLEDFVEALNAKNPRFQHFVGPIVEENGEQVRYVERVMLDPALRTEHSVETKEGLRTPTEIFEQRFKRSTRRSGHKGAVRFRDEKGVEKSIYLPSLIPAALDTNEDSEEVGLDRRVKRALNSTLAWLAVEKGLQPVDGIPFNAPIYKNKNQSLRRAQLPKSDAPRNAQTPESRRLEATLRETSDDEQAIEDYERKQRSELGDFGERIADGTPDAQAENTDGRAFGDVESKKPLTKDSSGQPIQYSDTPLPNSEPAKLVTFDEIAGDAGSTAQIKNKGDTLNKQTTAFLARALELTGVKAKFILADVAGVKRLIESEVIPSDRGARILAGMEAGIDGPQAKIVPNGDHYIIVLRPVRPGAMLAHGHRMMELGHEFGHALFDQLRESMPRSDRRLLEEAHAKAAPNQDFEEWFADQVATFLRKKSLMGAGRQGKAGVFRKYFKEVEKAQKAESIISQIAQKMRDFIDGLFADSRFDNLDKTAERFFKKAAKGRFAYLGDGIGYGDIKNFELSPLTSSIREALRPGVISRVRRFAREMLRTGWGAMFVLKTADRELRDMGQVGRLLADQFYRESNSRPQTTEWHNEAGLFQLYTNNYGRWLNALSKIQAKLKENGTSDQEIHRVLKGMQAQNLNADDQNSETYRLFRQYLNLFHRYANGAHDGSLGFVEGYFPRMYDVQAVKDNRARFREVLLTSAEGINEENVDSVIDNIIKAQSDVVRFGPSAFSTRTRNLTGPYLDRRLVEAGFVHEDPIQVMGNYVQSMVKRAEFSRRFGARGDEIADPITGEISRPWVVDMGLERMINRLPEEHQARARKIMDAYGGRLGMDMSPKMRKFMSGVMVYETYLTLLFSTLASIPDVAGPMLRSKSFDGAWKALRVYARTVKNRKEAIARFRTMGIVNDRLTNQALLEQYGLNHMSGFAQNAMDTFFKYNLQESWTNMTRVMSAAVAEDFLVEHAYKTQQGNQDSKRYLDELHIDADTVLQWQAEGRRTWNPNPRHRGAANDRALKVQDSIGQFVDESIVRPNAAQRPVWASDPRFMLLWHLKSFFYAYGKVIVAGAYRETMNRYNSATGNKAKRAAIASAPMLMMAMLLLPLAGLGLELRELIQYGGAGPTDRMETGDYASELMSRAGIYGPVELGFSFFDAKDYGKSGTIALMGPAFQHLESIFVDDWDRKLSRSLPIINQIPWLRAEVGL